MNDFIFDGLSSSTFNAYVASSNFLDGASRDIQSFDIPGRSGNVFLDNGRYNNFSLVVNVYIPKDIARNAQDLKAFLLSHSTKYYVYEETFAPGVYRMARFAGEFTIETFDRQAGAFTIEFDCMPQRFLKSGTQQYVIPGSSRTLTLNNPTAFDAKPLIRIYGDGSIWIQHGYTLYTVTVNGNPQDYVDVDCETLSCTYETSGTVIDVSRYVTLADHEYPLLASGETTITRSDTLASAYITPRWWTI